MISLLIVPEALVKGHLLIGPLARSSSKNMYLSWRDGHTHASDTRAHNIPARMNGAALPRERASERADERTDGWMERTEERRAGVSLSFPDSEI